MGLRNILRNIQSRGLKDVTNLATVKSYLDWKTIQAQGLTLEADEIISFSEQIAVRAALCADCVEAGECTHCKCSITGKISTPTASCSAGKWGPIVPAEDWKADKSRNNTKILVL